LDDFDSNQFRLYPITEGFATLTDKDRVVAAMFALMERFPDAYLGTPGPLVHSIESIGIEQFEQRLVESVARQPAELNVWMVNRILNTKLEPSRRRELLHVLRSVPHHPTVPKRVAEIAIRFLEYQAKQGNSHA
jgi:hypothetical protein